MCGQLNLLLFSPAPIVGIAGKKKCRPTPVSSFMTAKAAASVGISSSREKTAVVTFEDGKTNVPALLAATSEAGFPTKVLEE